MPPRKRRRHLAPESLRLQVADALRCLSDIPRLAYSDLTWLEYVMDRSEGKNVLFPEAAELNALLEDIANDLIQRLPGCGKVAILRETLEGVLNQQSVSAIARSQGKSREHFSRTYWKQASQLVADELYKRCGLGSTTQGRR